MDGKSKPRRKGDGTRGFVHAVSLMSGHVRKATGSRGFSKTRVLTHWAEIVGPNLAEITKPAKVSFAREGFGATLTILASGARAPEVQMQLEDIRARVNSCYGYNAIARVRITQTDASAFGFSEEQKPFEHVENRDATLEDLGSLDLENVKDDGLRDALLRLGKSVLTARN